MHYILYWDNGNKLISTTIKLCEYDGSVACCHAVRYVVHCIL